MNTHNSLQTQTSGTVTTGTFSYPPANAWKFCPQCGVKLGSGWNFCTGCGTCVSPYQNQALPFAWKPPMYPAAPLIFINGFQQEECQAEAFFRANPEARSCNIHCSCPKCSPRC